MRRLLVSAVVSVLAILVVESGPAAAHASLVGSDPADGSSLAEAPRKVSMTFNENVGSGFVAVTAPDGTQVKTANVRTVDHVLSADVAASDERGRYTVAYRIVSADGHPVSGEVTFTTTTGRTVHHAHPADQRSFVHRHRGHLVIALAVAVVAIGLVLAPLRRGQNP